MKIKDLQLALDSTGFAGKVLRVFSSKYGHEYQVGLAELSNGLKVVIKIKQNPRAEKYKKAYSRAAEYQNLVWLERLSNPYIPKPLYYKNGVLIMSFMPGTTLRMTNPDSIAPETYQILGSVMRTINDSDLSGLEHLIRFNTFREFLTHELELFFHERLALRALSQLFYDEFKAAMFEAVQDDYPADVVLVAKDAYGGENILIENGKLSGLIDFEDLMIAPRLLQLRPPIEKTYLPLFIEGYGRDVFERNYYEPHLLILKAISSLRAFYLATESGDTGFQQECISRLREILGKLESKLDVPFE